MYGRLLPVRSFIVATYGSRFLINTEYGTAERMIHMQFKDLEWKDVIADGVLVCSTCEINLCGWIKIEFRINHEPGEDKYYLYSFGKGSIRRLEPEKYGSAESAKNTAYKIYNNEMARIKKAIDYLVAE